MTSPDPSAVANAYFRAVGTKDVAGIRAVFAPDAELVTIGGTSRGLDAIAEFYEKLAFASAELQPAPGPFVIDGNRLAVEIELRTDGRLSRVADFFTIEDGLIRRLAIYMGPNPPPPNPPTR